jgi:ribonuclease D
MTRLATPTEPRSSVDLSALVAHRRKQVRQNDAASLRLVKDQQLVCVGRHLEKRQQYRM